MERFTKEQQKESFERAKEAALAALRRELPENYGKSVKVSKVTGEETKS